ncbi:nitrate- and nitrite sensing domain-containing protein [Micromonospora sonneratiae]|uniref:histidine kinase n=1 Tax=Micromonospora sonneratiae TaxID=1184706 RepID=A0ABW3YBV2_9ACTN
MNTRNWPIRSKIIALVTVPIAALLTLWIFATTLTVGPALSLLNTRTLLAEVGVPGEAVIAELQQERRLTAIYLAGPGDSGALADQRRRTDDAVAQLRRRATVDDIQDSIDDLVRDRLNQTFTALEALSVGRGFVDKREMDRSGAQGLYTSMIDSIFRVFTGMAALPDEAANRQARALISLIQARELFSQTDALLAGVYTAGRFAEGEHVQLVQAVGSQRLLYAAAVAELSDADRTAYQRLTEGEAFSRMRGIHDELVARGRTGAAPPVTASNWRRSYDAVQEQLRGFETAAGEVLTERTMSLATGILVRLGLASVLGLVAIIVSLAIALRIGRSLVRRLTSLRATALDMAGERLPAIVGRLRRGEEVDVARETPPMEYGGDEIGQVGHAFSEVHHTAVRSAVDEAALRRGLNEVFLNIARRSQALLHRQLALLDKMERRAEKPEELEALFRVDHLATRMRRHAEDLVILAGAAPGRGWRNPVSMIDVIRGAISEVEDYARVDIVSVPPAAVLGRAVGDVIHVLAELIENATAFSPPDTRVQVSGQVVANGYAIEIVDRGLGMTPEAIEDANRRLADPPEFDPSNSARLGLFVVAQLGTRHGVRVRLRPSPYGGITAVALVPGDLVTSESPLPVPAGRPASLTGGTPDSGGRLAEVGAAGEANGRTALLPNRHTPRPAVSEAPPGTLPFRRPPGTGRTTQLKPVPSAGSELTAVTVEQPTIGSSSTAGHRGSGGVARPVPELSTDGLPRRVRQGSLAPQLRTPALGSARSGPNSGEPSIIDPPPRSPAEVRAMMSALQSGTVRGRQDAGWPDAPTAAAVPPAASALPAPPAAPGGPAALTAPDVSPVADLGSSESGRDA